MEKHKQNKKGFTIIEVVLVLAIAGLIFLTIFLALPALQRSQRDTQRKQDVSLVITALNQWKANNRGRGFGSLGESTLRPKETDENGIKWNTLENLKINPLAQYLEVEDNSRNSNSQTISRNILYITVVVAKPNSNGLRTTKEGDTVWTRGQQLVINVNSTCESTIENERFKRYTTKPGTTAVKIFLESGGIYCQEA